MSPISGNPPFDQSPEGPHGSHGSSHSSGSAAPGTPSSTAPSSAESSWTETSSAASPHSSPQAEEQPAAQQSDQPAPEAGHQPNGRSGSSLAAVAAASGPVAIGGQQIFALGSEIVECLRIGKMIERHGDLFINRVYTPAEIDFCNSRNQSTQHFAGRWAAKEAILRAIGLGYRKAVSWKDIEIRQGPDGRPAAHLTGGALEICQKLGITGMMLTISHCRSHATASALALGVAQPQPINSTLIDKLW